jgi:predicted DNA-binding protein
MAKVTFSARKDPLLRPPRGSTQPSQPRRDASADKPDDGDSTPTAKPPVAKSSRHSRGDDNRVVEGPVGVIAVSPQEPVAQRKRRSGARSAPRSKTPEVGEEGTSGIERSRHATRRVQTSVSLPPETWDALDELGQEAGVAAVELLTGILTAGLPDTPESALSALEQLLVTIPPDDGPHEERNYRLPLELRTKLDELSKALGARPRKQRSLLIRAILASQMPKSGDHARELITTRRLDAMRAALATPATR